MILFLFSDANDWCLEEGWMKIEEAVDERRDAFVGTRLVVHHDRESPTIFFRRRCSFISVQRYGTHSFEEEGWKPTMSGMRNARPWLHIWIIFQGRNCPHLSRSFDLSSPWFCKYFRALWLRRSGSQFEVAELKLCRCLGACALAVIVGPLLAF